MSKKKKIMTISDLYNFCVKNKFYHFSSIENQEEICVSLPASFESEENADKDKEGLIPFVAKAYHDHINLNKSEIKPEVLESTLPSAMLRPILANIVVNEETGEKDFGSHDMEIVEDQDGNTTIKYIEQPVGVIFGENSIEYDAEDDVNRAILHGFLFSGYCQDAVDIMNRRQTVACSVELCVREMSFNADDKVLTLDDFYVSGLTLLGESVKEGMKGSRLTIKDFCKNPQTQFTQGQEQLIEMLEQLNAKIDNLSNFTIQGNTQTNNKEGGIQAVKFNELLEKYGKTVEEIDFEYEGLSDAELEAKFIEKFGELEETDGQSDDEPASDENNTDNTGTEENFGAEDSKAATPEKYSVTLSDGSVKEYALTLDDITTSLWSLVDVTYAQPEDTYYYVSVFEDGTLVMHDYWSGRSYRQNYSREDNNFALVGERVEVYANWLTKEEEQALETLKSDFAQLTSEFAEITERINKYEAAEKEADEARKTDLFADEGYASIADTAEFKQLEKDRASFTSTELEERMNGILGKYSKLAFHAQTPTTKHVSVYGAATQAVDDEPYGGLFKK